MQLTKYYEASISHRKLRTHFISGVTDLPLIGAIIIMNTLTTKIYMKYAEYWSFVSFDVWIVPKKTPNNAVTP